MDKNKASGIDKVTKEECEQNLEENLENLVKRMRNGSYRPNPTRRIYIPKETKGKLRPLGISSYEDKLVVMKLLFEPIHIFISPVIDFIMGRPGPKSNRCITGSLKGIKTVF